LLDGFLLEFTRVCLDVLAENEADSIIPLILAAGESRRSKARRMRRIVLLCSFLWPERLVIDGSYLELVLAIVPVLVLLVVAV
jgi:hypothetical protein